MVEQIQYLLEQISDTSIDRLANIIFLRYHKRYVDSIFDTVNSNFKKIISLLTKENIKTGKHLFYDKSKSFTYAEDLKKKLESKFKSNICFSEKFHYGYSFFQSSEESSIPYLRLTIIEDAIKLGLIEERNDKSIVRISINQIVGHDDIEKCVKYKEMKIRNKIRNYPVETSILYLKIRPFIIGSKKVVIVEEIQSTLVNAWFLKFSDPKDLSAKKREQLYYIQQLIKKYLKSIIDLLLENCDILYLVRQGIPKHQRFLYEDFEKYRCGNPFRNLKFMTLISPIVFKTFPRDEMILNDDYEYLYCLKEIRNIEQYKPDIYSLINFYIFNKLNNLAEDNVVFENELDNLDFKELLMNSFFGDFTAIEKKFENRIKKIKLKQVENSLMFPVIQFAKADDMITIVAYMEFAARFEIGFDKYADKGYKNLIIGLLNSITEKKLQKLHRKLLNSTTSEIKNKDILGFKPQVKIKSNYSNDIYPVYKLFFYKLETIIKFQMSFSLRDVLRKAGIKI